MDDDVRQLLLGFQTQITALTDQLRAKDAQLAAKDEQNRVLMEMVVRIGGREAAPAPVAAITIAEVYALYEKAHQGKPSWKSQRNRLKAFVAEFGSLPAMSLTTMMWAKFREKRKTEPSARGTPLSPLTINFELEWAKHMLTWASDAEQGLIPSNPLTRAKSEKVDSERDTWLTLVEIEKLLVYWLRSPVMRLFLMVAVSTGLRISEVLRIRRDQIRRVELQDGRIIGVVEFAKRKNKTRKTYYGAIPPGGMALIDAAPENINPHILPSPYRPGQAYGQRQIRRLFRKGCEETKIDYRAADGDGHIRCHDLRHSAATLAAQSGATLPQVQRMLNHTTPVHTVRYLHYQESDAIDFALLMEGGMRKAPQRPTAALASLEKKATV